MRSDITPNSATLNRPTRMMEARLGKRIGLRIRHGCKMNLTKRTELRRIPDRGSRDRETINQILDAGFLAHVGFCMDGQPFVIPTLYGREGDKLYLHGEVRCGPPLDNEEDYGAPVWAGILPLEVRSRPPIPDDNLVEGVAVPEYVLR